MRKLRLFWMIALASLVLGASAQNQDKKWAIGANVVRSVYTGDLGDTFFDFDKQLNIGGGLTINRYLNRFFDLGLYGSWSKLGFSKYSVEDWPTLQEWYAISNINEDGTREWEATNFKTSGIFNANLQLRFKFLGNDNARIVPYLLVSGGAVGYDNLRTEFRSGDGTTAYNYRALNWQNESNPVFAMTIGSGGGFDIRLSRAISLRYQFDAMWTDHDNRDFVLSGNQHGDAWNNDWQFQHSLGLVWSFGKQRERRVVERIVEVVPAIVDSDGDGVPDDIDECPNTPRGCRVDAVGCPIDSDGDGVCDGLDRCPNTTAGVAVDAHGCPIDTDGDGVPDYLDKCPNERGPASNDGCPVVVADIQPAVVNFATSSYTLNAAATRTLDTMVSTLQANAGVQVKIEGHTDSTGSTEYNRALANSRANAVRQYLVQKGIAADRIVSTEGFWYSRPVGNNQTVAGRAANRRAEVIQVK